MTIYNISTSYSNAYLYLQSTKCILTTYYLITLFLLNEGDVASISNILEIYSNISI